MTDAPGLPWTAAQVRVAAACDVVAVLALVVATFAAGGPSLQDQVLWLDVAVLGLVVAVVANGSLLLVARRAIGRRRLRLLPDVAEALAPAARAADGAWWWLPGTVRAHVAGCQMIAGKPAQVVSVDRIRADGLQRCELCR